MNQSPDDAWFYTREGERIGPVTFTDLLEKVAEASLDPRHDMVWRQGMADWKPAGEIEGLFSKRTAPAPQETLAPQPGPYAPPKGETAEELMGREIEWPGARRRSYLLVTILFPFVWNFIFGFLGPALGDQLGPEVMIFVSLVAALVPLIAGIYFGLMRLTNLGMSRWWFFGHFVPFLNFWIGYRCFACPAGYAYHKKLDGTGIALAILYWLIVLMLVLAIAAFVALYFGMVNNPDLQDHLREMLRTLQERSTRK